MTYKLCCGQISVVVHSSSTRRWPSSPEDLEPPRVSKVTSSSSSCSAPLLHPEIFVFFQFHVRHVLETSSTRLAHWEASTHCPAVSSHGLTLTFYQKTSTTTESDVWSSHADSPEDFWEMSRLKCRSEISTTFYQLVPKLEMNHVSLAFGGKQQLFIEMKLKRISTRSIALL